MDNFSIISYSVLIVNNRTKKILQKSSDLL